MGRRPRTGLRLRAAAVLAIAAPAAPFACRLPPPATVVGPSASSIASSSSSGASAAPSSSAAPSASIGPTASSSSSAAAAPTELVPLRRIEMEDPSVTIAYPFFHLESEAAGDTINALLEREALASERGFLSRWQDARKKGAIEGPVYLRRSCHATFLKPRIASVDCSEVFELGPHLASVGQTARTFAIDSAVARVMKPREFFRKPTKPGPNEEEAPSFPALAVLGVASVCKTKKLPEAKVDDAIDGFVVDAKGMEVVVKADYGCSAGGWSFRLEWSDVPRILDPAGPITRVKP